MKTVSKTFELQTLKLPQCLLGYQLKLYMQQDFGQIQGMFNGLGFMCQAAFEDFEGKTGASVTSCRELYGNYLSSAPKAHSA